MLFAQNLKAFAITGLVCVSPASAEWLGADTIHRARTRQFAVTYSVNASAAPLEQVDLWYRIGDAESWQRFGADEDLTSPMSYTAEVEGLHELFFVLTNPAGTSGELPQRDTIPHLRVFVDHTPPLIQLQRVAVFTKAQDQMIVRFEWSAMDNFLEPRPVRISYRPHGESDWRNVRAQLPNTGLYEWKVPVDVSGEVVFRVSITDRGGNISSEVSDAVQITRSQASPPAPIGQGSPVANRPTSAKERPSDSDIRLSAAEQHRVNQLIRSGTTFQNRRNHVRAVQDFRQVLAIDPQQTGALVKLGRSLYSLGRNEEAASAFESALAQSPNQPGALLGLADTFIETNQMGKAESKLLELVASGRQDASAWLRLGDVSAFKGLELAAHDYYVKAATTPSESLDVSERAKARLLEMFADHEPVQARNDGQDKHN